MQAFILIGSQKAQQEYLERFCEERHIKELYTSVFSEFKILDARNLIKKLSFKLDPSEKHVISISSPTVEAQHAVLKTIEELPEHAYVFFLVQNAEELLPTIHSRCLIIQLEREQVVKADNGTFSEDFSQADKALLLAFCEQHSGSKESFDEVIIMVRTLLLKQIAEGEKIIGLYEILSQLMSIRPLVQNNNVQSRLALENILLKLGA